MRHVQFILLTTAIFIPLVCSEGMAWDDITTLSAGGDAKEVGINKDMQKLKIACQDKPIIVNTVVMREGGKKTPFTLGKKFNPKEEYVLDLGGKHHVTGFRISDDLKGTYKLQVE
ncbi:MAG TPA: hypothetical protein ENK96_01460 [Desulfobulbaceae bacterium]|nr:hypothetical protein [Desulfobulbaceae bacterium]